MVSAHRIGGIGHSLTEDSIDKRSGTVSSKGSQTNYQQEGNNKMSDPASTLIKKIATATGAVFEPAQIKRIAKAEATAEVIRAETRVEVQKIEARGAIEIQDVRQRAAMRWIAEETRRQQNIEAITGKTIPMLNPAAEPDKLDDDWLVNFFDKSRLVSDDDMQNLWAKILAGEANKPGSYSKRVVAAVSTLSKSEAGSFNILCSFGWMIGGQLTPLIYDVTSDVYNNHGLGFDSLAELDTIGLISFAGVAIFTLTFPSRQIGTSYHGELNDLLFSQREEGCVIVGDDQDTTTD